MIYYAVLFIVYRYLVYEYVTEILDRQMLGFSDTLALTAVLSGYLVLCAVPPFLWSRKSHYHPVWRGVESFSCYLLVAFVFGIIFAVSDGDNWSALSGISASGAAWARIGSVIALLAVFICASWLGGKSADGHRRRVEGRKRGRRKSSDS